MERNHDESELAEQARSERDPADAGPETPEADAKEQARPGPGEPRRPPPGPEVPEADAQEQRRGPG